MGLKLDLRNRQRKAREDNHAYRYDIASARDMIYKKGVAVQSKAIQDMLKDRSLVPTEV